MKNKKKTKQTESWFDVRMGSWYLHPMFLAKLINKKYCGLYRDDALLILRNVNGQQIDRM